MKQKKSSLSNTSWLRRPVGLLVVILLFFASRFYILNHPPPSYSDVSHDYERYANMWQYGLTPYLKHFYEYPPATVPLLWIPLLVDQAGIGKYYPNYRVEILLLDTLLFFGLVWHWRRSLQPETTKMVAIGFYLITPVVAKDFFYEGIDLAFIGSLTAGLLLLTTDFRRLATRIFFWAFFWLSFAIKFMSLPLAGVFFYLRKLDWKRELIAVILGGLLVWGVPVAIFRSSLTVSVVFHARRPLKYASFPSFLVEMINYGTQTEVRVNEPPDFQLTGPVSQVMTRIFGVLFPVSVVLVLLWAVRRIFQPENWKDFWRQAFLFKEVSLAHLDPLRFGVKLALVYIFTLFLTGKVFSQPFHIWYLPLIAVFPFMKVRRQLIFMALALWLLLVDTTPWIRFEADSFPGGRFGLTVITGLWRFVPMMVLLYLSFRLPDKAKQKA